MSSTQSVFCGPRAALSPGSEGPSPIYVCKTPRPVGQHGQDAHWGCW